ncbi:MAG: N-acetylmuramoyl-L-alanine amidase [Betaproteobacteria bacterium]|nr:N-acetylmuramoyl-L-alanine amidase [Betaproteobacteria bacterium]MBA3774847.1 N-acetylmuramoyl-L-alanine amidase [Betaproteobacteria bacterium]
MQKRDRCGDETLADPPVILRVDVGRRRVCGWLAVPATQLLISRGVWANSGRIASVRIWPAQEYTRVIIESTLPVAHQLSALKQPERVVLDLNGIELTAELAHLPGLVQATDPYIASIRFGHKTPQILRVVLDLKGEVRPDVFALQPVAGYGHRLVLDLYPLAPVDPLMALLESEQKRDRADSRRGEASPPQARDPEPRLEPRKEARLSSRRITVAIDPGHGGEDPGAIGPRGTYEKDVVLAIAKKLKAMLDATPNMRAMLTRDDDYFVPLRERVHKARRVQADLFISIHADAFRETRARGSSVFALSESGATSAAAKWLAQKENASDLIGGVDLDRRDRLLARTLLDLSQTAQISDSLRVGRHVLDNIGTHNALHKATVEQASFAVLKAPDIPSILVETAFISNPDEELKLRSGAHQQKFAASILEGVKRYFARNPGLARA